MHQSSNLLLKTERFFLKKFESLTYSLTSKFNKNFDSYLKYAGSPGLSLPRNIGDALSPYIYKKLSGQTNTINVGYQNFYKQRNYMIVGSILQFADENTIVWGAGFNNKLSTFGNSDWQMLSCRARDEWDIFPRKIYSVRGPLTRDRVLESGMNCPSVFGDPAILMPAIYRPPPMKKRYKLGIVPHYYHARSSVIQRFSNDPDVAIISVFQKPENFINKLLECESIASSSLHGLILAKSYEIPSIWMMPDVFFDRESDIKYFKFRDYLNSIQSDQIEPLVTGSCTKKTEIIESCRIVDDKVMKLLSESLLRSCPFIKQEIHDEILNCVMNCKNNM